MKMNNLSNSKFAEFASISVADGGRKILSARVKARPQLLSQEFTLLDVKIDVLTLIKERTNISQQPAFERISKLKYQLSLLYLLSS